MTIGCIIQARTTSTRLPKKIVKPLEFDKEHLILEEVILRVKKSTLVDSIIIGTTQNKEDECIELVSKKSEVECFRGSEHDVLSRYYEAAVKFNLDIVIRITSDCPFIDPEVMDELIRLFKNGNYDYASNTINRTYPHGLDCEIFSMKALEKAYNEAKDSIFREHVTNYMYMHPKVFKIGSLELPAPFNYSDLRITVDTEADYIVACIIYEKLKLKKSTSYKDIVEIYNEYPYIALINKNIVQKKQLNSIEEKIKEGIRVLELQDLEDVAEILKQYRREMKND